METPYPPLRRRHAGRGPIGLRGKHTGTREPKKLNYRSDGIDKLIQQNRKRKEKRGRKRIGGMTMNSGG